MAGLGAIEEHSLSETPSPGEWLDVCGVVFQADLTSSVDLDPWVKDSDAQRAGELIDPVLMKETDKNNPSGVFSKPLIIIINKNHVLKVRTSN